MSSDNNSCAFDISGATVNLTLEGSNFLTSGQNCAGLRVPDGASLTITAESTDGRLTASSGGYGYGAGIGGNYGSNGETAGTITISGGNIIASSTYGAGIGGGSSYTTGGASGSIIIEQDAVVFATGGSGADHIGAGGASASSGTISFNGGVVFKGDSGELYGDTTPTESFEIPNGKTLTIPEGKTLTIASSVTVTNNGTIEGNGTIHILWGGKLTNPENIPDTITLVEEIEPPTPPTPTPAPVPNDSVIEAMEKAERPDETDTKAMEAYNFWMGVKAKIRTAKPGATVRVTLDESADNMPASVMETLYQHGDVALRINWHGRTLLIPAGQAQPKQRLKAYWSEKILFQLYA